MDLFEECRYSCAMAATKSAALDPIACCSPVRTDVLDEDQATCWRSRSPRCPIRSDCDCSATSPPPDADEVCACDLVEPSGRSQPTVSHHMKILVDAGLIEREKRGLWVWYRLVPSRLDALRSVLG